MASTSIVHAPEEARELQERNLLDRIVEQQAEVGARYMPTLTVKQFTEREKLLRELKDMLVEGIDYGVIPGTEKPVLLLPGAQKICTFFGYVPHYEVDAIEEWMPAKYGEPLFYYKFTCLLRKDGKPVGEGQGSCNSWESKYRYRAAKRKCPACGNESIIQGKQEYGGGWLCFAKKGGCGAKFAAGDPSIEGQKVGRVTNPDFADAINTVQKMGQKRAYVAATLSATGASQYFTQDLEDSGETSEQVAERRIAEERARQNSGKDANGIHQPGEPARNGSDVESPRVKSPEQLRMLQAFQRIKADLRKVTGSDDRYYQILGRHGYEHCDQIADRNLGLSMHAEMMQAVRDALDKMGDAQEVQA